LTREIRTINDDQNSTLVIRSIYKIWHVLESVSMAPEEGPAILVKSNARRNVFDIEGDLSAGIVNYGPHSRFNIGATSEITGTKGVAWGAVAKLFNAGVIHGTEIGVYTTSGVVNNTGEIDGPTGADISYTRLINKAGGHINGTDIGVALDSSRLINAGAISSNETALAITGKSTIENKGTIDGDIRVLDGGQSHIISLHGTINGTIFGGTNADTYKTNQSDLKIVESVTEHGGPDTVCASVNFSLQDNIEILRLVGGADIDGHGNESGNEIHGNKGDNKLFGHAGSDFIDGGAGDDILIGGAGEDQFIFWKGLGQDTLTDYVDGEDKIVVFGFIGNFTDLEARMSQHGDDVWIDLNKHDRLIIEDVKIKQIDSGDFGG